MSEDMKALAQQLRGWSQDIDREWSSGVATGMRQAADALDRVACAAPQWQPIETAPKDGSFVLLRQPEKVPDVGRWSEFAGMWSVHAVGWQPTHWMPLPVDHLPTGASATGTDPVKAHELLKTWQAEDAELAEGGASTTPAIDRQRSEYEVLEKERDERFTEADVRELMLSAADEWDRPRQIGEGMTTLDQVVDHLLAEHKAQQPCATPTSSSPSAATDTRS